MVTMVLLKDACTCTYPWGTCLRSFFLNFLPDLPFLSAAEPAALAMFYVLPVAFYIAFLLDDLADAVDLILVEIADLLVALHARRGENALRTGIPDAEDVGQRDDHMLVARKIHACDTCHS